jgi:hypothetical protein
LCHLSQCTEFLSGSLLGCFLVFSSSFSPFWSPLNFLDVESKLRFCYV